MFAVGARLEAEGRLHIEAPFGLPICSRFDCDRTCFGRSAGSSASRPTCRSAGPK
jgi:hypothetical protein